MINARSREVKLEKTALKFDVGDESRAHMHASFFLTCLICHNVAPINGAAITKIVVAQAGGHFDPPTHFFQP